MTVAILIALFVWWFSTGAILWAVSRGAGRLAVWASAPWAMLAVVGVIWAAEVDGAVGAYAGFGAAILVWGWFELAFLTGVLTGPNNQPCPPDARGWRHFLLAWGTLAHHELSLLLTVIGIGVFTWNAPEHTGLWTFLILFFARISAKLNVYLGVPNLSHEMLPGPVTHLKSYFAKRRMNWLFPVSVSALTFAVACWIERAYAAAPGSGAETGFVLLATLTTLALLEHWLMVLPIRDAALWQWMTRRQTAEGSVANPADG